jgi:hydroxymethylglutaryl-CoA reductase (NADPH)
MATLIPRRFRPTGVEDSSEPSWLRRQVTGFLTSASSRACIHPIHTIGVIALLASTTYIGLLEGSIFDAVRTTDNKPGQLDVRALLQGSRSLRLGDKTSWHWQTEDNGTAENYEVCLALHTIAPLHL